MVSIRETGTEDASGGRGMKRHEGVVPGSTNQGQDAIDRHVARGWFNGFQQDRGWQLLRLPERVVVAENRKELVGVENRSLETVVVVQTRSAHSVTLTGKPY